MAGSYRPQAQLVDSEIRATRDPFVCLWGQLALRAPEEVEKGWEGRLEGAGFGRTEEQVDLTHTLTANCSMDGIQEGKLSLRLFYTYKKYEGAHQAQCPINSAEVWNLIPDRFICYYRHFTNLEYPAKKRELSIFRC